MQDDVLSIEMPLALNWCILPETVSVSSLRQNNRLSFSLIETSDDQLSTAHETHHSNPELQRIENKLNLLIEMVAQLSDQSQQSFPTISVKLSCKGIEWLSDVAVDEAASLLLQLCLDGEQQHAVKIIAQVVAVTEQGGQYRLRTRFTSLDEAEESHLEKWIFTHHRRRVAQARSRNPAS